MTKYFMGRKNSEEEDDEAAMLRIGTSGWTYKHWKQDFYAGVPARKWLEHYAARFDSVEINATFYGLPAASTFDQWRERVPESFLYAVKASRLITHNKKLNEPQDALAHFLDRARRLGSRLGPILYQLPPGWNVDADRLRSFTALLPEDLTHVFEFREQSWFSEPVRQLLEETGMAFCIHDMHDVECPHWVTSKTVYIRFHGPTEEKYTGSYSTAELDTWAVRLRQYLEDGRDVYAYFNNDIGGHAVRNAEELRDLIRAGRTPLR
jgi:uncharacterized protein YecE (DUF72 family)